MLFIDELWSQCQRREQAGNLENFSVRLCDRFDFDFWISKRWPVEKVKRALALNLHSGGPKTPSWSVYGLTTEDFDYLPYVDRFSRDQYGKMDLKTDAVLAFYDPINFLLRVYDFEHRRAAFIYKPDHVFVEWEVHSPFRDLFHYWALKNDALLIHSGIISADNSAILLPGAGGKGKSTTVMSCLDHGMKTTGDDYNLFYRDEHGVHVYSIYGNMKQKLAKEDGPSFNFSVSRDWASEILSYANKIIYYPPEQSPVWEKSSSKVVGILCPEISTNEAPQIKAIKSMELINNLAMSSIMHSPVMAKEYLASIVRLSKQVTFAKIHLSPFPKANAGCIQEWLKTIRPGAYQA